MKTHSCLLSYRRTNKQTNTGSKGPYRGKCALPVFTKGGVAPIFGGRCVQTSRVGNKPDVMSQDTESSHWFGHVTVLPCCTSIVASKQQSGSWLRVLFGVGGCEHWAKKTVFWRYSEGFFFDHSSPTGRI